jgi:hypothetical protein
MSAVQSVALAVLIAAMGARTNLTAQWPSAVAPGTRVRARLPESQYQADERRGLLIRGRITSLVADTLYLAVTDSLGPLPIPRSFVQRLEISRGVPSRGVSALERGLLTGLSGALTGLIAYGIDDEPDGTAAGTGALVLGGVGLVIGSISGALHPRERWKRVRLE